MKIEQLVKNRRATLEPTQADVKNKIGVQNCTVLDITSSRAGLLLVVGVDNGPVLTVAAYRVNFKLEGIL